jgi:saccharopine dehydrogenase (NADP+, L-glutamate forming)/spermidine synthase
MKKVLVLGAGLVSGPLVHYLLDQPGFEVTVASRTVEKAQRIVGGAKNGVAKRVDVNDEKDLENLISQADLSISLLPFVYHPLVARLCVKHKKQMVTASYVKDEMRVLDEQAKQAGVILLNEIGVDPGIDHMSAMRVIDNIRNNGGELESFTSYCGGLPAPDANDNPFGYKFSWSPRGVVLAGKNPAQYLKDGKIVDIPGEELFSNHWLVNIEGFGELEAYPNRDSLPYIDTYGIHGVKGMLRGTLRYPGWCETLRNIAKMGLLDEEGRTDLSALTLSQFTAKLVNSSGELKSDVAGFLGIKQDSAVMSNLEWLGLFSDDPVPAGAKSPVDVLAARMLEMMQYAPGEKDMLVMQHEFVAKYPDRKEKTISTMIDYGIPNGDTSMSRTVGLPAAIATRLILEGKINRPGVQVPVTPEIYEPVLTELESMGIKFREKTEVIQD